jgi:hypothetical protein
MHKKNFKTLVQIALFFSLTTFASVEAYEEYLTHDTHVVTDNPGSSHLTLEDGSEWKISDADLDELHHWFAHSAVAPVVINPNYGSSKNYYGYYLTNQDTGSYVKANLVGAPLRENTNTVTILGLEKSSFNRGCIYLSNGTFWCVAHADLKLLKNWHMNDLVIIGKNTEWFSYETHILINVEANTFVRAQRI